MPFDENGFLGYEIAALTAQIREKHKELFALCYEINRFVEKTKFHFKPISANRQAVISSCLFIKLLEGVQAAIILIRMGLDADAQVVIRGVFETLVHLILSVKEKDFSFQYLLFHDSIRLSLFRKSLTRPGSEDVWAEIRKLATKEDIDNLEKGIRAKGFNPEKLLKKFKFAKLAERAGLSDLYDSFYSVVSDYAHTRPSSLGRFVEVDAHGEIRQLNHRPCDTYAKENLTAIAEFTLEALSAMCKLFNIKRDSEIHGFHERLKKFS